MLNERRIARRYARAFLNDDVDKDTAARLADEVKAFVKALEGEINEKDHRDLITKNLDAMGV